MVIGCAEATVNDSSCEIGKTTCDQTGTKQLTCRESETGQSYWGPAVPCPGGGRCVNDACESLCDWCETPPGPCFEAQGICADGKCVYELKPDGSGCDDEDPCTTGDSCSNGACRGQPIICNSPPPNTCKDANTLTVSPATGICQGGACQYDTTDVGCNMGCENGVCKGDPCQNVTCNQPPGPCFKSEGFCTGGSCNYLYDDGKICDDNDDCTDFDKCLGGSCLGTRKICDSPPPDSCKDTATLISFDEQGNCSGGQCTYTKTEVACSHGCNASTAACKSDPCATVTCDTPPTSCYKTPGTCTDGKCIYEEDNGASCNDNNDCTENDTCTNGSCQGSLVICNTPPPNSCKDANTLTVYAAPGSCSGGTCTYGSASVHCEFGCDSAKRVCAGDPCGDVTCDSPPNTECYSVPGLCSGGACTYLTKSGASCNDQNPCTASDKCDASGGCSGDPYDCNDGLDCTGDVCDGLGGCSNPLAVDACLLDIELVDTCYQAGELNPSNACQFCDPQTTQVRWTPAQGSSLISYTFEDASAQGFSFLPSPATSPVKWQVDCTSASSGACSLYFGDTGTHTYDDPGYQVTGSAVSPAVLLPASSGKLCLRFMLYKDTENSLSYDQLWIEVLPAGTTLWESGKEVDVGDSNYAFIPIAVDISAYAGTSVQFQWSFDSSDDLLNFFEGVYLDDIEVLDNCVP